VVQVAEAVPMTVAADQGEVVQQAKDMLVAQALPVIGRAPAEVVQGLPDQTVEPMWVVLVVRD